MICVPAPAQFVSTTQHTYKPEEKIYEDDIVSMGVSATKGLMTAADIALMFNPKYLVARIAMEAAKHATNKGLELGGYNQIIQSDFTDQVYKPGGQVRSYEISLYMPCLSVEDSRKAGEIIRAFEDPRSAKNIW